VTRLPRPRATVDGLDRSCSPAPTADPSRQKLTNPARRCTQKLLVDGPTVLLSLFDPAKTTEEPPLRASPVCNSPSNNNLVQFWTARPKRTTAPRNPLVTHQVVELDAHHHSPVVVVHFSARVGLLDSRLDFSLRPFPWGCPKRHTRMSRNTHTLDTNRVNPTPPPRITNEDSHLQSPLTTKRF